MRPAYHNLYKNEAYLNAVSSSRGNARALNLTLIGIYISLIKFVGVWTAFKVIGSL